MRAGIPLLRIGAMPNPGLVVGVATLAATTGAIAGMGYAAAVAAAAILGLALLTGLRDWRWSLYGLLLYLPLAGIPSVALYPDTALPVLLKDILFVIPAYVGFAVYARGLRTGVLVPRAPNPLFALLAVLVVAQAFNPALPNPLVGLIGIKVWLFYIPLFYLGYQLVRRTVDLSRLLSVLVLSGVIPAIVGIAEAVLIYTGHEDLVYASYGAAAAAVTQNFAETVYSDGSFLRRIPSTFPFITQYYLFVSSMVAVTYAWWRGTLRGSRLAWFGGVLLLLSISAAFLSGARGAFLLLPLLLVLIVVLEGRPSAQSAFALGGAALALIAAAALLGTNIGFVLGHALDTAVTEFSDASIDGLTRATALTVTGLGTGIDTNQSRYAFVGAELFPAVSGTWYESWYVKVILELGIMGLGLVLLLLGTLVLRIIGGHRRIASPPLRSVSAGLGALLLWVLVYNVKAQYPDVDPINVYFWLFAGILFRLPELDRGARTPTRET